MDLWSVCAHFPPPALLFESEGPLTALKIGCDENDEVPDSGAKSSVSQSVHSLSPVRLFATPWIAARQASLSITNSRSSLRLTSIELVMPSSHLILRRPLLLLPPIPPSIRVFSMSQLFIWSGQSTGVSASASFPPKKSQGWFPLEWTGWISLQSKGLLSLLQHHSSKASILKRLIFLFPES